MEKSTTFNTGARSPRSRPHSRPSLCVELMSDFLSAVPGAFSSDFPLALWGALAEISLALTALYWASRIQRLGGDIRAES